MVVVVVVVVKVVVVVMVMVVVVVVVALQPLVGVGGLINDRVILSPRDVFISAGLFLCSFV